MVQRLCKMHILQSTWREFIQFPQIRFQLLRKGILSGCFHLECPVTLTQLSRWLLLLDCSQSPIKARQLNSCSRSKIIHGWESLKAQWVWTLMSNFSLSNHKLKSKGNMLIWAYRVIGMCMIILGRLFSQQMARPTLWLISCSSCNKWTMDKPVGKGRWMGGAGAFRNGMVVLSIQSRLNEINRPRPDHQNQT